MAKSTVAVKFVGDVANFKKSLDKVDGGMDKLATGAKKAAAAAGVALIAFGVSSVKAFAEAEEAQKRLGDAFERFPALAGTSQKALQKYNSELQKKTKYDDDSIASGQAVIAQFGVTGDQLEEVTPLLLDFASRTGVDVPSAAMSMGKALLGNARALKSVGIEFTATGDRTKDFDTIMGLLREQVGGFAEKEGTTAAGKAAILANQFGELQEKVGSKLVPALSTLADVGIGVLSFIENMDGPTKIAITAVAGLATAAVTANIAIGIFKKSTSNLGLGKMVEQLKSSSVAMSRMKVAAVGLGATLAAAVAIWEIHESRTKANEERVQSYTDAIIDAGNAVKGTQAHIADLVKTDEDLATALDEAGVSTKEFGAAAAGSDGAWSKLAGSIVEAGKAAGLSESELFELESTLGRVRSDTEAGSAAAETYKRVTEEAGGAASDAAVGQGELAGATDAVTEALAEEEAALKGVFDATLAQFDSNLGYRQSLDDLETALSDLATARQTDGAASEEYRDKLMAAEKASLDAAASAVKVAEDQYGGFLTAKAGSEIYRAELVRQRDALAPGSPLRQVLQGYIDKLGQIPAQKQTRVFMSGIAEAMNDIDRLIGKLGLIRGGIAAATGTGMLYRAEGGPVKAGQPYVVGEEGPEVMVPAQRDGRPNSAITGGRAINGGSSAPTVNVYVAGSVLSERDLVATINKAVSKGIR